MRKIVIKHGLLATVTLFAVSVLVPVGVSAVPARAEETQETAQEQRENAQEKATEKKEAAQTKLADAKLKACEKRQVKIQNIMSRIADRGTKQLDVFTKISERTQAFYVDKGRTVANYDALVADVNEKKTTAETTVLEIKDSSTEFVCSAEDPKGSLTNFKESLKAEITALKEYKTAVKNLIVGVKSAQSTTTENGAEE